MLLSVIMALDPFSCSSIRQLCVCSHGSQSLMLLYGEHTPDIGPVLVPVPGSRLERGRGHSPVGIPHEQQVLVASRGIVDTRGSSATRHSKKMVPNPLALAGQRSAEDGLQLRRPGTKSRIRHNICRAVHTCSIYRNRESFKPFLLARFVHLLFGRSDTGNVARTAAAATVACLQVSRAAASLV